MLKTIKKGKAGRGRCICFGMVQCYGLVFIPLSLAVRLAKIHSAAATSVTWQEFVDRSPSGVMEDLFQGEGKISFHEYCRPWLYQALTWPERYAVDWFRDAMVSYKGLSEDRRYPLPAETCWASDAIADGGWPEFPARAVSQWMPKDIVSRYGVTQRCTLNDNYVSFDPSFLPFMISELAAAGFRCRRAQTLVNLACGNGLRQLCWERVSRIIKFAECQAQEMLL